MSHYHKVLNIASFDRELLHTIREQAVAIFTYSNIPEVLWPYLADPADEFYFLCIAVPQGYAIEDQVDAFIEWLAEFLDQQQDRNTGADWVELDFGGESDAAQVMRHSGTYVYVRPTWAPEQHPPADVEAEARQLIARNETIKAVGRVQELTMMGLTNARDYIYYLQTTQPPPDPDLQRRVQEQKARDQLRQLEDLVARLTAELERARQAQAQKGEP